MSSRPGCRSRASSCTTLFRGMRDSISFINTNGRLVPLVTCRIVTEPRKKLTARKPRRGKTVGMTQRRQTSCELGGIDTRTGRESTCHAGRTVTLTSACWILTMLHTQLPAWLSHIQQNLSAGYICCCQNRKYGVVVRKRYHVPNIRVLRACGERGDRNPRVMRETQWQNAQWIHCSDKWPVRLLP
jgi:hypothetical protein